MKRNTDFTKGALKRFALYCTKPNFFALPFQMGRGQSKTRYILVNAKDFYPWAKDESTKHFFRERKGALVWKALDALAPSNRVSLSSLKGVIACKDFPVGITSFEAPEGSTLSDKQEQVVCAWISNEVFPDKEWKWVGRKHTKHIYNTDIISNDGIMIEVKGKSSDLCTSYKELDFTD